MSTGVSRSPILRLPLIHCFKMADLLFLRMIANLLLKLPCTCFAAMHTQLSNLKRFGTNTSDARALFHQRHPALSHTPSHHARPYERDTKRMRSRFFFLERLHLRISLQKIVVCAYG